MINFPEKINVTIHGKSICFQVKEVRRNVYAIRHKLHILQNADDLTFGYIIYQDYYLYAYTVIPANPQSETTQYDYRLIYVSYVGPESNETMDAEFSNQLFMVLANTFVLYDENDNMHPGIIDKENFAEIYTSLKRELEDHDKKYLTPYVTPVHSLAIELRDFYATMVDQLETLKADE